MKDRPESPFLDRRQFLGGSALSTAALGLSRILPGTAASDGTDQYAVLDGSNTFTGDNYFGSGRPWIDVGAFGAKGDGVSDDTQAVQEALDALPAGGGTLCFPPGLYRLSSTLTLPASATGSSVRTLVQGYGAVLLGVGGATVLQRLPSRQSDASAMLMQTFTIRGLTIRGTGAPGQAGIRIGASYGVVVEDCNLESLDTGLDLIFCPMARVESCFARDISVDCFVARSAAGMWTDATVSNSPSAHVAFRSCRAYGKAGQRAEWRVTGSQGVSVQDCVAEGENPVNDIDFDWAGGTSVKLFTVRNLHCENAPTGAVVRAVAGGRVVIEGLNRGDVGAAVLVDGGGSSAAAVIHIRDMPWISAASTFRNGTATDSYTWVFDGVGVRQYADLSDPAYWAGGTVPDHRLVSRSSTAAEPGGQQHLVLESPHVVAKGLLHAAQGIAILAKAGAVTDADFAMKPPDGTLAVDTAGMRLYVRVRGSWKSARLA